MTGKSKRRPDAGQMLLSGLSDKGVGHASRLPSRFKYTHALGFQALLLDLLEVAARAGFCGRAWQLSLSSQARAASRQTTNLGRALLPFGARPQPLQGD